MVSNIFLEGIIHFPIFLLSWRSMTLENAMAQKYELLWIYIRSSKVQCHVVNWTNICCIILHKLSSTFHFLSSSSIHFLIFGTTFTRTFIFMITFDLFLFTYCFMVIHILTFNSYCFMITFDLSLCLWWRIMLTLDFSTFKMRMFRVFRSDL